MVTPDPMFPPTLEAFEELERRVQHLNNVIKEKNTALTESRDKFLYYKKCHEEKLPSVGTIEKARVNNEMAKICQKALDLK